MRSLPQCLSAFYRRIDCDLLWEGKCGGIGVSVKVLSTYFGWLRINFNKDFNRFYIIAGNTAYQHSTHRLRLENTE